MSADVGCNIYPCFLPPSGLVAVGKKFWGCTYLALNHCTDAKKSSVEFELWGPICDKNIKIYNVAYHAAAAPLSGTNSSFCPGCLVFFSCLELLTFLCVCLCQKILPLSRGAIISQLTFFSPALKETICKKSCDLLAGK